MGNIHILPLGKRILHSISYLLKTKLNNKDKISKKFSSFLEGIFMHIGHKLRYLIESRGFAKKHFARMLQTTEQNLHKILSKESIQVSQLLEFCRLLKVHPHIFFDDFEMDEPVSETKESPIAYHPKRKDFKGSQEDLYERLLDERQKRIKELHDHIDSLKNK